MADRFQPRKGASALAIGLLAASSSPMLAVPACPDGVTVQQPEGRPIRLFLRGDEHLHWHEDQNGYTILQGKAGEPWVYANSDATGGLVRSSHVVGDTNPGTLGLSKRLLPTGAIRRASGEARTRQAAIPLAKAASLAPPSAMKNLVLLVAFSDKAFTTPRADFESLFNTIGYTADGANGSVRDYYNEVSYGQLSVESVVVEPVTLPRGYAYYGRNNVFGNDVRPREMVQKALELLQARGFDFSTLDSDNDGWVDGLTVIHAGGGEEYSGNNSDYIWSHQWELTSTVTYDGKSMRTYHTEPERRGWDSSPGTWGITRIGVICHETGHFLGLPDLYDYGYDSQGAGDFCLMAGGSWNGNYGTQPAQMSAWCKKTLSWLTPVLVTGEGPYTVPRVEDGQTVFQLAGLFPSSEYFLVENRQGIGFDAGLPGSSRGLLIWHVDETVANNDNQAHYKVDLEEAGGVQHLEINDNAGTDEDYFRAGTMTTFSSGTTPNSLSYSGAPLGLDIVAVSASGNTMTFTIGALPTASFDWDPIGPTQSVDVAFPVGIRAKNIFGGTVPSFTGSVILSGHTEGSSIPLAPLASGSFTAGSWTGLVTVAAAVNAMYIRAEDGTGHAGESGRFDTLLDSDGDGLPDWWTSLYFGHPTGQGADLSRPADDASGTGENNLFKYVAGLDPTNPLSVFSLSLENSPDHPTQKRLVFSPRWDDRLYTLLYRTNLAAGTSWTNVPSTATNDNGLLRTVTDLNASDPSRFYRIRIGLP
jgi:M6 family metalloprotease-like protein